MALFAIQKTSAHSLYGRFRCLDDQGHQSISDWSAAVSIPAVTLVVSVAPAISSGPSNLHFDAWVFQGNNSSAKVIFSNSDYNGHGLILSDRAFSVGNGGGSSYESNVLQDSPLLYWRFNTITSGITPDSSNNANSGLLHNSNFILTDTNEISALGPSIKTMSTGYLSPSLTVNLGSNWTIETWFRYPFPDNCADGWCTLARGANDHQVIVQQGNLQLGSYMGGGVYSSGFSMQSLSTGWHYLATVGSGGTTRFYVDGAPVGSALNVQSHEAIIYVGGLGSQPFGQFDESQSIRRRKVHPELPLTMVQPRAPLALRP